MIIESINRDGGWWLVRGKRITSDGSHLVRLLVGEPIALPKGVPTFFQENTELHTVQVSALVETATADIAVYKALGFRLDPFHPYTPSDVVEAFGEDADRALTLGYDLSFAVRDQEDTDAPSSPRFPEKIHWLLVKWLFERALSKGNLTAAHNLAVMYLNGYGVIKDQCKAVRLLHIAEAIELPRTLDLLAECYRNGWGVAQNPKTAAAYASKASAMRCKRSAP